MTEFRVSNADWTSFCQLLQQLISGNVRRNTFSQWEMELLLDVQMAPIRRSSRQDTLRRYLREVQQQFQANAPAPPRFSRFFEAEMRQRQMAELVAKTRSLPRAS